jgi:hypothetical protein
MDSHRVSVLAKRNALQRVNLSGCVATSRLVLDFQSYEIILKRKQKGKKNLADHLRACADVSGAAVAPASDGLRTGAAR